MTETQESDGQRGRNQHNPQLGPDGTCWDCEDAAPGAIARISVGPLMLKVAVCEDCDEKLQEKFGS